MDIAELIGRLTPTGVGGLAFPRALLGSFRRKSITFFDGRTDERTVVYWFQSRSFSIDLRLHDANRTELAERQGWIGTTDWDAESELLFWDVRQSYQPRIQWPEPAKLYPIGNAILEFAPSNVYVEDWRQQSVSGTLLGLRLVAMVNDASGERHAMDGGLVIAGEHMAYVQSRLPAVEAALEGEADLRRAMAKGAISPEQIESYEVSVALDGATIRYSTQSARVGQPIDLSGFALGPDGAISQARTIAGERWTLLFELDVFEPGYSFGRQTDCAPDAVQWMKRESEHLARNAVIVN